MGLGMQLSKNDLKDAFRLSMESLRNMLETRFYLDTYLSFGLRSAPYLFNRLSEVIHWILMNNHKVHHLLHYLDNFLTAGSYQIYPFVAKTLIPCKSSKIEGPSTSITFLGIHLDTITVKAIITPEHKKALLAKLNQLYWRHRCLKRELLSLIGKLSFACKVVPSGRIFLHRLIDLSTSAEKLHHHLPKNYIIIYPSHKRTKCDMKWWLDFLPQWPRKSLILESHWTSVELFTDASSNDG